MTRVEEQDLKVIEKSISMDGLVAGMRDCSITEVAA
jgi:hypothetical protein